MECRLLVQHGQYRVYIGELLAVLHRTAPVRA